MITPCRRPSGPSTAMPCDASVPSRRWSSGTTTSPRSRCSSPRRTVPARWRRRRSVPVASLRELQQLFWRSLGDEPGTIAPELVEAVLPSSTLDSAARVQVYADAYSSRLLDVLREDFPRLSALLGRDGFEEIARDYLKSHPSEHPSVRHLGRAMAGFLEQRADLPPYLAELARLEWARIDVFDAPDAEPLAVDALRTVRPRTGRTSTSSPFPRSKSSAPRG